MSRAATAKGTRRRRRMELDQMERFAVRTHPAVAALPGPVRRRRLAVLHRQLATGRVTLKADA